MQEIRLALSEIEHMGVPCHLSFVSSVGAELGPGKKKRREEEQVVSEGLGSSLEGTPVDAS